MESEIKLKSSCFDTVIIYRLFQKLKLLGNGELNHYSNTFHTRKLLNK